MQKLTLEPSALLTPLTRSRLDQEWIIHGAGTFKARAGGDVCRPGRRRYRRYDAYYRLENDIVLGYWHDDNDNGIVDDGEIYDSKTGGKAYEKSNWIPIGKFVNNYFSYPFRGIFDGNGKTVSGIYISNDFWHQGPIRRILANPARKLGRSPFRRI